MTRPEQEDGSEGRGSDLETGSVVVRDARVEDLLALEWSPEYRTHRLLARAVHRRHQAGTARMLIAELDGVAIGQIWISFEDRELPELWALRVHPAHRGRGIGTRLIRAAEDVLRERGAHEWMICCDLDNHLARSLYQRLGYRVRGTRRDHYGYPRFGGGYERGVADLVVLRKQG